mgnify:CR=1 FL=1
MALAGGSLLLTLLLLEAVFRVAGWGVAYEPRTDQVFPPADGKFEALPHSFVPGANFVSRYASDHRGTFGPSRSVEHHFNSAGWRDREHSLEKPAGTYRILGLGDSYLFGQGVQQEETVLSRLEGLLREDTGRDIECINTGISGFNTQNERDLLIHRGLAYEPDMVVVFFVLNDVEPNRDRDERPIEFFREYMAIYGEQDTLSEYSRLWNWARRRFVQRTRANTYIRQCVEGFSPNSRDWRNCRAALDEIRDVCRSANVKLLVAVFPFFVDLDGDYPFQPIHDVVRDHCQEAGIEVLDLTAAYEGYRGPELWVHPTDQHPNEIAHDIAARAVAAHIQGTPALAIEPAPAAADGS